MPPVTYARSRLVCGATSPYPLQHLTAWPSSGVLPCMQRHSHSNACGAVLWQTPHMVDIVMEDQYRATR
jgi:hypothetical protein